MRVGGRIRRAELTDDVKFPALLPKNGHITKLVINYFHERCSHQGRTTTLNVLRSNGYWIISGSSSVSHCILNCIMCRKIPGSPQSQKMSDLPKNRLEPPPPFTYCAVDYFGPWIVKERRKEIKRYGVLFTCMASRAIHIEVAHSLDTGSFIKRYGAIFSCLAMRAVHLEVSHPLDTDFFILALRRFIASRGQVKEICSDNGTNFISGERELQVSIERWSQAKNHDTLLQKGIKWVFNPPPASHHGCIWERLIKSTERSWVAWSKNNVLTMKVSKPVM